MMKEVAVDSLDLNVFHLWAKQWMLLACGDLTSGEFNAMTVGWGSFGVMWSKPFVQIVVRHSRYTAEFMKKYDNFTLCAFSEEYKKALQVLGSMSGRDGDKIKESGLTPIASSIISSPSFDEAELAFQCRKIYAQDMDPSLFLDQSIEGNYPKKDYHKIYFGEIINIMKAE